MTSGQKFGVVSLLVTVLVITVIWRIETVSARILQTRYPVPEGALAVAPMRAAAPEGARLARVYGCFACHGSELTGHVMMAGPFGTRLTAPNLTRLVRRRSDAQLAGAIRYGIKPGGTSLIGMPAGDFIRGSDGDIAAIIAYLRTLPQRPDAAKNTRWRIGGQTMLAMGLLPPVAARVDKSARGPRATPVGAIALGRYITQTQCRACHGGDLSGRTQEASPDLRFSIKHYSPAAFARFFTVGKGQIGHGTKTMTRMIENRFRYLTPAEVRAVYLYLNTPAPQG